MKTWIKVLSIGLLALMLGACGKKSNKSNTVATTPTTTVIPTNSCLSGNYSYNPVTGQYVDNATGQVVQCQTTNGAIPGYNNGQGCDYWNQIYAQYGVHYQAVNVGGQLACVRSDLISQYMYQGGYYNYNPYQYQNQQLYTCNWGYDPFCNGNSGGYYGNGGCVSFGGSSWGNQFGLNGQIGLCW